MLLFFKLSLGFCQISTSGQRTSGTLLFLLTTYGYFFQLCIQCYLALIL